MPSSRATARAILFDLDGVLVDSRAAIARSINHALAACGLEPRPEPELHAFIGPPIETAMAHLLAAAGAAPALLGSLVASYRQRYRLAAVAETVVFPGTEELLDALRTEARLVVVTTKPQPLAEMVLEGVGLRSRFTDVVGPGLDLASEAKDVTLARALARLAGATPAALVGDRCFDVAAAHARGVFAIGVTWGIGGVAELTAAGADRIVGDHAELLDAVRRRLASQAVS